MISQKLKNIFTFSIPVFIAHGLEEYFTGLYNFDSFYQSFSNPKMVFVIVVLVLGNISLIIAYVLIQKNKWAFGLSVTLGLLLIFELTHIYEAVKLGGYYPGLITFFAFPIIGFFLWKELLKNYKNNG
jgi:uncharacterized membrane protein